jgi:hypothetical protein
MEDRLPQSVGAPRELFKGYIRVWERRTRLTPSSEPIDWHVAGVAGPPPHAVVRVDCGPERDLGPDVCSQHIFTFDTKTRTTTLVYEYAQGPDRMLYSLPAGRVAGKSSVRPLRLDAESERQLPAHRSRPVCTS